MDHNEGDGRGIEGRGGNGRVSEIQGAGEAPSTTGGGLWCVRRGREGLKQCAVAHDLYLSLWLGGGGSQKG